MSERLQIAFFANTFVPDVNGVATSVDNYRRELMRRGHAVYVFAPAPRKDDPLSDDPHVIRFPSLQLLQLDYQAAVPLSLPARRAMRRINFDVVHTHHPFWVGVWGRSYARRLKIPLVTTIHTHYELFAQFVPLPERIVKAYLRSTVRSYCRGCTVVTTPGASTARHLKRMGVEQPMLVLPNGVDLAPFEAATGDEVRAEYGLAGKYVMGYLGRLSPEKQVNITIEAAAEVFRRRPEARLLIVGDGPARADLEALVRSLKVGDRVIFTGSVAHEQVPKYHAAMDVLLSASRGDTMPLAYAETMATGTPVIVTIGFGAVDMIVNGVNGFLIPRANAAAQMVDLVMKLVADRELRDRMSAQARESSRQWRVDVATDRLLEIYDIARRLARGEEVDLETGANRPGEARAVEPEEL